MCGIAGFFCTDSSWGTYELDCFRNHLQHRGPNGNGTFYENGFGLAHTRLSIQDTSTASNQPFFSANQRFIVVFNGEIYNFKELAKEFSSLRTTSDTEVLVELFAKYGIDCVHKLRGMFSFAIFDREEKKLWLVRDRLGIKPLYIFRSNKGIAFASELKALTSIPSIKDHLSIDYEAQNHYYHMGFVPEPHSIYNEINKFPSAHWASINTSGSLQVRPYWQLDYNRSANLSYEQAKKKVHELLVSSVHEHLIADVPVGLFLSGGSDSSLLAAIAQKNTSQAIKTFSIGFANSKRNEAPYAKKIAEYLKTDHTEYILHEEEILEIMDDVLPTYDEPFADSSAIPTLLISKLASEKVKVALSGEGGDELFLGYGTYTWAERLSHPFIKQYRPALRVLSHLIPGKKGKKAEHMLSDLPKEFLPAHIFSQEHEFSSAKEVYDTPFQKTYYSGYLVKQKGSDLIKLQNIFDLEVAMKDNLLVKVDRAGMRYGLETRVPFLDHRLVELLISLPASYKIKDGVQKRMLKDILFEYIPQTYFNRPKWGFGVELGTMLMKKGIPPSNDMPSNKQYASYIYSLFSEKKR